jgi:hypothetical protein
MAKKEKKPELLTCYGTRKITEADYPTIFAYREEGKSNRFIGKMLGTSRETIRKILKRERCHKEFEIVVEKMSDKFSEDMEIPGAAKLSAADRKFVILQQNSRYTTLMAYMEAYYDNPPDKLTNEEEAKFKFRAQQKLIEIGRAQPLEDWIKNFISPLDIIKAIKQGLKANNGNEREKYVKYVLRLAGVGPGSTLNDSFKTSEEMNSEEVANKKALVDFHLPEIAEMDDFVQMGEMLRKQDLARIELMEAKCAGEA